MDSQIPLSRDSLPAPSRNPAVARPPTFDFTAELVGQGPSAKPKLTKIQLTDFIASRGFDPKPTLSKDQLFDCASALLREDRTFDFSHFEHRPRGRPRAAPSGKSSPPRAQDPAQEPAQEPAQDPARPVDFADPQWSSPSFAPPDPNVAPGVDSSLPDQEGAMPDNDSGFPENDSGFPEDGEPAPASARARLVARPREKLPTPGPDPAELEAALRDNPALVNATRTQLKDFLAAAGVETKSAAPREALLTCAAAVARGEDIPHAAAMSCVKNPASRGGRRPAAAKVAAAPAAPSAQTGPRDPAVAVRAGAAVTREEALGLLEEYGGAPAALGAGDPTVAARIALGIQVTKLQTVALLRLMNPRPEFRAAQSAAELLAIAQEALGLL